METVRWELSRLLGGDPAEIEPLPGGDIGQAFRVETASGEVLFAKTYSARAAPAAGKLVIAEAAGLRWLAEAEAIRVPEVRAVSRAASECSLLVIEWVGPGEAGAHTDEPPARLHGDLWGGNWIVASDGEPVLIDPAVYGGHREIDLAMMKLFGGFSARVFAAYEEVAPVADGHGERVALHQLYPLLVHLNLFGAGYAASVERALRAYT